MSLPFNHLAARALTQTGQNYSKQPQVPAARAVPKSTLTQALELAGRGFAWCIAREKEISAPFAKIPYPGLGAARILDFHAGLPHGHAHWPLPNVPLPSIGPLIPLPWGLSGADKTKINSQAAARCGDFGLGIWCGGYTPMNEVFFGSASVWIESARAARTLDITDHCMLADPPTCGIAKGAIVDSSGDVKIGGAPMPSLTQAAVAAGLKVALKAAVKGGKAAARAAASVAKKAFQKVIQLFRRVHRSVYKVEKRTVERFMKRASFLDDAYKAAFRERLENVAKTTEGRRSMDEFVDSGKSAEFYPKNKIGQEGAQYARLASEDGSWVFAKDHGALIKTADSPGGKWMREVKDPSGNLLGHQATDIKGPNTGSGSRIYYDPTGTVPKRSPTGTLIGEHSPDAVLAHELSHVRNNALGTNKAQVLSQDPAWNRTWENLEEFEAVKAENAYHGVEGTPLRDRYN